MDNKARYTYGKQQKLKKRDEVLALFEKGKAINQFPVRAFFLEKEAGEPGIKAGVGVSKRNFKKAVDRNRVKRLLRECYRLQKNELEITISGRQVPLSLFFIYTGQELPEYKQLFERMGRVLEKIRLHFEDNK